MLLLLEAFAYLFFFLAQQFQLKIFRTIGISISILWVQKGLNAYIGKNGLDS